MINGGIEEHKVQFGKIEFLRIFGNANASFLLCLVVFDGCVLG